MTSSTKKYYCKFRINYIRNDNELIPLNQKSSDNLTLAEKLLLRNLNGKLGYLESIIIMDPSIIYTAEDVLYKILHSNPTGSEHSIDNSYPLIDHITKVCEGLNADPNKTSIEILVLTKL